MFPVVDRYKLINIRVQDLISEGYRYIYLDSAEDVGVDWVNDLIKKTSATDTQANGRLVLGDFWITVDPYQGLRDTHTLTKNITNQVLWQGNLPEVHIFEEGFQQNKFVKLQECFRMPSSMINHIDSARILPTRDLPSARDVKSLGVVKMDIELPSHYNEEWLAERLAGELHTKVMMRGIHPGHCAVLYDFEARDGLFPIGGGDHTLFVEKVNHNLRSIPARGQQGHMPQLSNDIEESILYNGKRCTLPLSLIHI